MGRRKIEIKAIKDDRNRSVTFLKRKGGLFKKAHELSVLCSVDVAVIIFGHNKKLYEFCSGDIREVIGRHSYYEAPHEHKGPADFQGKKDAMDDDDDDMDIPSRPGSRSSNDHPIPHHLQPLGHMGNRHSTSASPPIPPSTLMGGQGTYMQGRVGTPQPMSRPSSRNQRRNSSNMVPPSTYAVSQGPPAQNGFAYMSNGPVFAPQPQSVMPMQQANMNQMPVYPYPQTTQAQAQAQAYMNETNRRQSMPPAFPSERSVPSSENSPPNRPLDEQVAPAIEKRAPAKSRSMFTPIGPSESLLAQHFGFGQEPSRSHSVDVGSVARSNNAGSVNSSSVKLEKQSPKPVPASVPTPATTSSSVNGQPSSVEPVPPPPSRTNSMASNPGKPGVRPRLKVQIPSEHSDAGDATAESSPRESAGTTAGQSVKGVGEGNHPVVLPPPSPSVTLRSAGASGGPVNPFARPPPATTGAPSETPISALPSRFCDNGLLPSPSTFYQDWGIGFGASASRAGGNPDMLPSPLNFQTPVVSTGRNIFGDDSDVNGKRKSPGSDNSDGSVPKRVKT
ncbi:unnamed protein product [Tuber aestivum]|uniref:MADS-box domain-containing protein n=1 Tax=Tuber aestivum TaxID=59557 RepID=A0A292PLZ5_9PEZI|nr:unnamed protein product [Tuber aestivum]